MTHFTIFKYNSDTETSGMELNIITKLNKKKKKKKKG